MAPAHLPPFEARGFNPVGAATAAGGAAVGVATTAANAAGDAANTAAAAVNTAAGAVNTAAGAVSGAAGDINQASSALQELQQLQKDWQEYHEDVYIAAFVVAAIIITLIVYSLYHCFQDCYGCCCGHHDHSTPGYCHLGFCGKLQDPAIREEMPVVKPPTTTWCNDRYHFDKTYLARDCGRIQPREGEVWTGCGLRKNDRVIRGSWFNHWREMREFPSCLGGRYPLDQEEDMLEKKGRAQKSDH